MQQVATIDREPPSPHLRADLEHVLDAWQEATARLERTHESLSGEVRRLTDELEVKNRELARKNRLADLGQIASHIAHEVRNSLVPVTLYLGLLKRRLANDAEGMETLAKMTAGCTALDAAVNDLLHFTADRDPQRTLVDVRKVVDDIGGALAPQLAAQKIAVQIDVPCGMAVSADGDMLRRAVLNLALNAVDAMPDGGTLFVAASYGIEGWELSVADTGRGLSDDALRRAFEPFFTTKHNGTGLGLAIVYRIAEVHGGCVTAANTPGHGACFTFRIPQYTATPAADLGRST